MFTPLESTLGALLLHHAATGFLFKNGNVLGASGLLREAIVGRSRRGLLLLAGVAISFLLVNITLPELIPAYPAVGGWQSLSSSCLMGLLTGVGTKLSFGCTSGHMLCGLSRLSARSMVAVMTFFPVAILAFNIFHGSAAPLSVCSPSVPCYTPVFSPTRTVVRLSFLASGMLVLYHTGPRYILTHFKDRALALQASITLTGAIFGMGLLASGMANPEKVSAFFAFPTIENWDPSLLLIVIFGILPSLAYSRYRGFERVPELAPRFELPQEGIKDIDWTYIVGAALFGVSWGISGVCPGPAILRTLAQPVWGVLWMGGFYIGSVAIR